MTAQRLRQAAERLEGVESAVAAREYYGGSWSVRPRDPWRADSALCIVADGDDDRFVISDTDEHLLHYIATMHPRVALALADWLMVIYYIDLDAESPGTTIAEYDAATAVADAILGEA